MTGCSGSAEPDRSTAFAPVGDTRARVLILGSLPGAASLAAREYYAHPRNAFWRLVGTVIGTDLAALPYGARLARLVDARIALGDVIASAARKGSLDAAIRDATHADLAALVAGFPELRAVGFNGRTAAKHGRASLRAATGLDFVDLPSSSPAHAAMPFAAKLRRWSVLSGHLR